MYAFGDCARAIYQSWAVIGLGLSAFALSAFMPTRRFGILMLTLLTISSIGNLVLLPALLAGPAGRWFWRGSDKGAVRKSRHKLAADRLPTVLVLDQPVPDSMAGVVTNRSLASQTDYCERDTYPVREP
jgi:hypothetical protein